jgi:hypothetical protein
MSIKITKDLFVLMLNDLRHGAERSHQIYEELGNEAQEKEIKEALDAREFISSQILSRLDECFRLIGEKPVPRNGIFCTCAVFGTSEILTALREEVLPLCGEGVRLIPPLSVQPRWLCRMIL